MSCSNLPKWPGAAVVYSKAYKALEHMAASGHVSRCKSGKKTTCFPSEEMNDLIRALDSGDEERIKGLLLYYKDRKLY